MVLTTHCHADHWLALEEVVSKTGAITTQPPLVAEIPIPTHIELEDGDEITLGESHSGCVPDGAPRLLPRPRLDVSRTHLPRSRRVDSCIRRRLPVPRAV